jgi:hypothetical protein
MDESLGTLLGGALGFLVALSILRFLMKRNFSSPKRMKSRLTRVKEFKIFRGYEKVWENAKEAIRLYNLKLQRVDPDKGELSALTGMDLKSFGEIITIKIEKAGSDILVRLESTPAVPFTLFDQGKNQENVDALEKLIRNPKIPRTHENGTDLKKI